MSAVLLDSEDVVWFRDDLTVARVAASRLAERIGRSAHRAGEVALAVSEAASNLVKHAVVGTIALRIVRTGQHAGIEFLAIDRGPGISDVPRPCATDVPVPVPSASAWAPSPGSPTPSTCTPSPARAPSCWPASGHGALRPPPRPAADCRPRGPQD
ncbi:ATP-binding protein [Streptacidiphilus sp. P02-A3a]|uniref:ATP-binding protein n=1 Tax=Streptacidiphilus sp. P02-A3a TaxID=2704468 RepID=UPI0015F7DA16|nr:ATP-binding protein [Streptacidiphilus sp. P02-A3a]QMU73389.1 hypothetical protein GXP74_39370 [Streptacidiphilus sp. P02-A3a]